MNAIHKQLQIPTVNRLYLLGILLVVVGPVQSLGDGSGHLNCLASTILPDASFAESSAHMMTLYKRNFGYLGAENPDYWDSATCKTGKLQSPINFVGNSMLYGVAGNSSTLDTSSSSSSPSSAGNVPVVTWGNSYENVEFINNGHTVQVQTGLSSSSATELYFQNNKDKVYKLDQFHFHDPSEHTTDGKGYPLEVHFVFKHDSDIAVIAVFFDFDYDDDQVLLDQIVRRLPPKHNGNPDDHEGTFPKTTVDRLDLTAIGNHINSHSVFRYEGSLTTPPCTEHVEWTVASVPLGISAGQLKQFWSVMSRNNRYTQPLNSRGSGVTGSNDNGVVVSSGMSFSFGKVLYLSLIVAFVVTL